MYVSVFCVIIFQIPKLVFVKDYNWIELITGWVFNDTSVCSEMHHLTYLVNDFLKIEISHNEVSLACDSSDAKCSLCKDIG